MNLNKCKKSSLKKNSQFSEFQRAPWNAGDCSSAEPAAHSELSVPVALNLMDVKPGRELLSEGFCTFSEVVICELRFC